MIDVQNLCKSSVQKAILTGLTFHLEAGDRLALLGANGSGKTLLLKILATLTQPTSGTVTIAGCDAFANLRTVRPLIGYVPEAFEGYSYLSIGEYLDFFAAAYKLTKRQRSSTIQDVLDLMDLTRLRDRKIQSLSSGEKRRLCLAQTFLHDPQIWLLDEPLSGLDARGQLETKALIQELGAMGKTIVFATNRPADVMNTCNCVGILAGGHFAVYGNIADLSRTHRLAIEIAGDVNAAKEILEKQTNLTAIEMSAGQIQIESQMTDAAIARLLRDLIDAGVSVLRFQKTEQRLEDLFLEVTKPPVADGGNYRSGDDGGDFESLNRRRTCN